MEDTQALSGRLPDRLALWLRNFCYATGPV
jgi:hypothetical protein